VAAADATAARTNAPANGYKVSLSSDQYQWGSNGAVANYGVLLLVADRMSPHPAYTNAALNDLHYLLGCNTHATCFVTHLGSRPVLHPHHRPSASPQYAAGPPWPGMLSGGPNSRSDDGSALDAIPSSPPAKRWVDLKASYASNEIAINWQAPLVFLLAWTLPVPMAARPGPDQP
jgi:endoglucanase